MSPEFLVRRFTEKLQSLGLKIFRVREPITFALHTRSNIGPSFYSRHARIHAGSRGGSMGTCVRFIFARLKVVLRLNDTLGRTIPDRTRSTACESKEPNQSKYRRFNVCDTEKLCKQALDIPLFWSKTLTLDSRYRKNQINFITKGSLRQCQRDFDFLKPTCQEPVSEKAQELCCSSNSQAYSMPGPTHFHPSFFN
jgi:hypothetical protein